MKLVIGLLALFVFICVPSVCLTFIFNLPQTIISGVKDIIDYFVHKKKRLYKAGQIVGFIGLFGMGKTLSAVNRVCTIYRAKHGLRVFCPRRKKWVTQVVHIVSNVHLTHIPYEQLVSLEQVVKSTDTIRAFDDEHDTLTITLVLIDEAGSELSHRDYMKNINPLLLNSILTCRHWNISIFYTAQRFQHVDALLRQVTSFVYSCEKRWRFQILKRYNAWDLEHASSPANVSCEAILSWFVRDSDYNAYDTYECVDKLKKDMEDGKFMSNEEILALRVGYDTVNMDGVRYSKTYQKRHKKLY